MTTSCPGRRPTRQRACSAAVSGMCCPAAVISRASSTRQGRKPGTRRANTTRKTRPNGGRARGKTAARGGKTGQPGPTRKPAISSCRRQWGARIIRRLATRRATTSGADRPGHAKGFPTWPGLPWGMADYVPPLRDIRFVLEQLVDLPGLAKLGAYDHADPGTVLGVIEESGRFIAGVVARSEEH